MNKDRGKASVSSRRWPLPVLALLVILFFLPLLAGWEKFFMDDISFFFYPQQTFLSRALARGVIPWWNPHQTAGASPFYAHLFQSGLSPYNWLFLILGTLDPARDYLWMIKLPLAVSFLISAAFSYLFSRRGLRIGPAGSFLFSLAYTLSPAMIYFSLCPPEVFIQAWLPLFCLCVLKFSESGKPVWLVVGAIAFALVAPAGDLPVLFHVLFITALFATALLFFYLWRRDWKRGFRLAAGGIVLFGAGFLLSGPYWANMIDGLRIQGSEMGEVVEELSGLPQSLPPIYLITLFIPDYFGEITSHYTWGAAHQMRLSLNDANLLGGLALSFLVFAGFLSSPEKTPSPDRFPSPRGYWWVFFSLFIFGLLVVLGRYTPAYGFFRKFIPVLQMPYPVRFRSIECFALAGLLGVSADLLGRSSAPRSVRPAAIYLPFVLLFAALALLSPYSDVRDNIFAPGFRQLTVLGDWSWFLTGPLIYLALGSILILAVSTLKGGKFFLPLLILLITVELLYFSYRAFYFSRILNHRYQDMTAERYFGPAEDPAYRKIFNWRPEGEGEEGLYRRLHYRSRFDNLSWLDGSLSMLGFDIKPLDPRFEGIVEELTEGFPYELKVRDWGSRFWLNMSVRYFLSDRPLAIPGLLFTERLNGDYAYEATGVLPRFYFQDRWRGVDPEEERKGLLYSDLRLGGWCGAGVIAEIPWPEGYPEPGRPGEEGLELFRQLQEDNRVKGLDLSHPNRVVVELQVSSPALLVMTDLWHPDWGVTIDGEKSQLYRVNYLQRGVWCPPGSRRIIMEFYPSSVGRGLIAGAIGVLLLISGAYLRVSRRRKRSMATENRQ